MSMPSFSDDRSIMDDSFDIYADLPSIPIVEVSNDAEIKKKIDEAKSQLEKEKIVLENKYQKLEKDHKQLQINYSSLLKTSRAEISRKDRTIADLRAQLDNMAFRRNERKNPYRNNALDNNYNKNIVSSYQEYRQFNHNSLHNKPLAAVSIKVEPNPINKIGVNLPITANIPNQNKEFVSSNEYVDQTKVSQKNENYDGDDDYELQHDKEPEDESDDGIINKPVYVSTLYGERLRKKLKEEEQRENEAKIEKQINNEETKTNKIISSDVNTSNHKHFDNFDQKGTQEKINYVTNVRNEKTDVVLIGNEKVLSEQITQLKSIVNDKVNNKENLSIHNRQQHLDNSDHYNLQTNNPKINQIHNSEEKLSSEIENINENVPHSTNVTENIKSSTSSTSSLENPDRIHEEDMKSSASSTFNVLKHEEKHNNQGNEKLQDPISKYYSNTQNHVDSRHREERHRHTESRDREERHKKRDKYDKHIRCERRRSSHRRRSRSKSRSRSRSRLRNNRKSTRSSRTDSERKHKKDKIRTPKKDRVKTSKKDKIKTPKKNRTKSPKKEKSPHKSSHKDSSNLNNEKKETLKRKAEDIIDDNMKRKKIELIESTAEKISACKNVEVTASNVSQNVMKIESCPKIMSIVTKNNREINKQTLNSDQGREKLSLTQKNNLEKELEDGELEEGELDDSIDSPFLLKLSDDEDEIKNNANDVISVQNKEIFEKEKVEDTAKNVVDEDEIKNNVNDVISVQNEEIHEMEKVEDTAKNSVEEDVIKNNANDLISVQNEEIHKMEKVEDTAKNSVDKDKIKNNMNELQDSKININKTKLELENLTKSLQKEKIEIENQICGLINNKIAVNEPKSDLEKSAEISNLCLMKNKDIEKSESQQLVILPSQEMKKPKIETAELNENTCVKASDSKNNSLIKYENNKSSSVILKDKKNHNINNIFVTPIKLEQKRTTHLVTDAYKIFRKTPVKYEVGGLVKKMTPMKTVESVTNEIRSILSSVNSSEVKVQSDCASFVRRTETTKTSSEQNRASKNVVAMEKSIETKTSNVDSEKSNKPSKDLAKDLQSVAISNKDSSDHSKKQISEITDKSIQCEKKLEIKLNKLSVRHEKMCNLNEKLIEKSSNETSSTSDENNEDAKSKEHCENHTEESVLQQLLMNKNLKSYPNNKNVSKINDNNFKSNTELTSDNGKNSTLDTKATSSDLDKKNNAKKGNKKSTKVEKTDSNTPCTSSLVNAANSSDEKQNKKSTEEKAPKNQNSAAETNNASKKNILNNAIIDPTKKLAYLNGKKIILIPRRRRPVQLADSPPVRVVEKK